jgi:hypothetical protein
MRQMVFEHIGRHEVHGSLEDGGMAQLGIAHG